MKYYITLFLLMTVSLVYGQFEGKKWIVGADLGNTIDFSDLQLYPNVAYAINANTIVGVSGSGSRNSNTFENLTQNTSYESINSRISLNLFLKKYKSLNEKWFLNLKMEAGASWNEQNNIERDLALSEIIGKSGAHGNGFSVGVTPGLAYQPLKWMIVEGNLGYLGYSRGRNRNAISGYNSNGSSFNTSIQFGGIGVKFIL